MRNTVKDAEIPALRAPTHLPTFHGPNARFFSCPLIPRGFDWRALERLRRGDKENRGFSLCCTFCAAATRRAWWSATRESSTYAYGRAHAAVHDDTLTHGDTITSQMMKMMTIKCTNTLLEDEPTRRDEAPVFHRFHARCACVASRQQRHRRQQAKHRVLKRGGSWSRRARTAGRQRSPRRKGSRAPGPSP